MRVLSLILALSLVGTPLMAKTPDAEPTQAQASQPQDSGLLPTEADMAQARQDRKEGKVKKIPKGIEPLVEEVRNSRGEVVQYHVESGPIHYQLDNESMTSKGVLDQRGSRQGIGHTKQLNFQW